MDNESYQRDPTENATADSNNAHQSPKSEDQLELWATTDQSQPGQQNVHTIPLQELLQRFHTNPKTGLSSSVIPDARLQYGLNKLTPPKPPNYFWLLLSQLFAGFNSILWFAGILAILTYKPLGGADPDVENLALGILIFIIISLNSALNVYQQLKSIKIVAAFSKLLPTLATVRRDGREQQLVTDELVPGDIILIRMGDKLPADCRFLACDGLKVNTSELTGESKPITGTVRCTSATFMESTNIGFYSSMVEQGTGEAVVIATGDSTVLGKMSKLTRGNAGDEITGLHREVNRFVLFVTLITLVSLAVLWITWAAWLNINHHNFITYTQNIANSVEVLVAFLPLGLPSAVTVVLTIVAKQMYQQRVLVKSLQIIETFNSVSVIATDKTGTLTQNKMTITHLFWDTDSVYKVPPPKRLSKAKGSFSETIRRLSSNLAGTARRLSDGLLKLTRKRSSASPDASEHIPLMSGSEEMSIQPEEASGIRIQAFRDLLLGAALCNNAVKQMVQNPQIGENNTKKEQKLELVGDAADTALYNLCVNQCSVDIDRVRRVNPRLKVLPFNSANKFMISANQLELLDESVSGKDRTVLVMLKGAPDYVIQRCSSYKQNNDSTATLDAQMKKTLADRQEELGKNGYRVIAMCQQRFTRQEYDNMMQTYKEKQRAQSPGQGEDLGGFPSNGYCFIGLFSLLDPPRPEVPDAVLKARRAQIRVAMVTGDHPTTAKAIAKQVNILTTEIAEMNGVDTFKLEKNASGEATLGLYRNDKLLQQHEPGEVKKTDSLSENTKKMMRKTAINTVELKPSWYKRAWFSCRNLFSEPETDIEPTEKIQYIPYAVVVAGAEINHMDDFMWDWVLSHQELVFARTSPEQKLKIVTEFQRRAEVVAVTGDGTNDAPALKCAHLGVAMQSGTEVSKEAGDMILLDNNFASIIQAIETGRLLSDNLKKVAIYLLPGGSWSQIWPVFFYLWFGMPLPLSVFLGVIFCMLNDVFMSLAMVTEKAESDIMCRAPAIRSKDHLLNGRLLLHAFLFVGNLECFTAFFCFCYYWIDNGVPFYSFMFTYENFGIDPVTPYSVQELALMTNTAQCVYYCSLCLFQFFNYFATRTRYTSILKHNPLWGKGKNWIVFLSIAISIGIQLIITQVKWFNTVFHTGRVPVKYVMPTLGFGFLWLLIDELRKWCIRKYPRSVIAKIAW